ncbi:hypothetical protein ILYODFUR_011852 [Ilyodon furcidens]|uniref:Uncharacterized protein n=1 Tax=Ilyodon furcidens TaxID=33524 RepID=A0ABV0SYE2_9TELE
MLLTSFPTRCRWSHGDLEGDRCSLSGHQPLCNKRRTASTSAPGYFTPVELQTGLSLNLVFLKLIIFLLSFLLTSCLFHVGTASSSRLFWLRNLWNPMDRELLWTPYLAGSPN